MTKWIKCILCREQIPCTYDNEIATWRCYCSSCRAEHNEGG